MLTLVHNGRVEPAPETAEEIDKEIAEIIRATPAYLLTTPTPSGPAKTYPRARIRRSRTNNDQPCPDPWQTFLHYGPCHYTWVGSHATFTGAVRAGQSAVAAHTARDLTAA